MPEDEKNEKNEKKSCFTCNKFGVCRYYKIIHENNMSLIIDGANALTDFLGENCIHFDEMKG